MGCNKCLLSILTIAALIAYETSVIESSDNIGTENTSLIESNKAVVAADDGRCSEVGVTILKKGGNAVDASVAITLCLGVVSPTSSGIGGGGFMVIRSSKSEKPVVINMRETAPSAASEDMYSDNGRAKTSGPMSAGVPGELAGLYYAWEKYGSGNLTWRDLCEPAIKYAKEGFVISPFLGYYLSRSRHIIENDEGLKEVFVRNDELLKAGEICNNEKLGNTLEIIAEKGPKAFYDGPIGEELVKDVRKAGGILTMDDLKNYSAKETEAVSFNVFGYEIFGPPPPSSGTLGLGLVLKILDGYKCKDALRGPVGLHRLVEALKHMDAIRMNLGDPCFDEDINETKSNMLSQTFADGIRKKIHDDKTFSAKYYNARCSQRVDGGTSHICVVDSDRNVVSMTTTINQPFGGGMRSLSTGIILNNQMDDFAIPTDKSKDNLPPAETNYIKPNKRPLSSVTPIIILKDNEFAGAIGGGGGPNIIPAVIQIVINHFVLGMKPLAAVRRPRIYHSIDSKVVRYEKLSTFSGECFELSEKRKQSLIERGHKLEAKEKGAMCQFVVQNLIKGSKDYRMLTAVCDPRKGGSPAGY